METNHIRIDHEVSSGTPERDTFVDDYQCRQQLAASYLYRFLQHQSV